MTTRLFSMVFFPYLYARRKRVKVKILERLRTSKVPQGTSKNSVVCIDCPATRKRVKYLKLVPFN